MLEIFAILNQVILRNYSWMIFEYGFDGTFRLMATKVACRQAEKKLQQWPLAILKGVLNKLAKKVTCHGVGRDRDTI